MNVWRDKGFGIVALAVSGITAYLYLAVAAHALGPVRFAPLGALWAVVFLATAAFAAPLEIELARRVGAARGRNAPYHGEVRAGLSLAGLAGAAAVLIALLQGPDLDRVLFAGITGYTLLGAVALAGLMLGSVAKGACAGSGRLSWWGAYLLADGGSRLGLSIIASLLDPSPWAFAVSLALGPWLALLVSLIPMRGIVAGSRVRLPERIVAVASATSPLVVSAAASSVLTYVGAVMLPFLVQGPDARVGAYIAALSLARLPLFAFSPLVAIAVPRIAYLIANGDPRAALRMASVLIGLATLAGLLAIAVAWGAGTGALTLLFGRGFAVSSGSLFAVAVAAAAWLVATASASAGVAAGGARLVAAGWCTGLMIAVTAALASGPDEFTRTNMTVAAGAVGAAVATLAAALIAVRPRAVQSAR